MPLDGNHTAQYRNGFDVAPTVGVNRLQPFPEWLAARDARGILTRYGVPDDDPRWLDVLDRFLAAVDASPLLVGLQPL